MSQTSKCDGCFYCSRFGCSKHHCGNSVKTTHSPKAEIVKQEIDGEQPDCTYPVPPVCTANWNVDDWRKYVNRNCVNPAHKHINPDSVQEKADNPHMPHCLNCDKYATAVCLQLHDTSVNGVTTPALVDSYTSLLDAL